MDPCNAWVNKHGVGVYITVVFCFLFRITRFVGMWLLFTLMFFFGAVRGEFRGKTFSSQPYKAVGIRE